MSDHIERACWECGSLLHHEDCCPGNNHVPPAEPDSGIQKPARDFVQWMRTQAFESWDGSIQKAVAKFLGKPDAPSDHVEHVLQKACDEAAELLFPHALNLRPNPNLRIPLAATRHSAAEVIRQTVVSFTQPIIDCAEYGWWIIANANGGDWSKASEEWQTAAAKYRDDFHERIRHYTPSLSEHRSGSPRASGVFECKTEMPSSRICERGTKGCEVEHSASPATSVPASPDQWTAKCYQGQWSVLHSEGVVILNVGKINAERIRDLHNATLPAPRSGAEVSGVEKALENETPATDVNAVGTKGQFPLSLVLDQIEQRDRAANAEREWITCPECNGKGWTWWRENGKNVRCECSTCEGDGQQCNLTYVDRGHKPLSRGDVPALINFARLTLDYLTTTARSLRVMGDESFAASIENFIQGLLSDSLNASGWPPINPESLPSPAPSATKKTSEETENLE